MPLTPPAARELTHLRDISLRGYQRGDGLFDVEAHIRDTRTTGFANQDRGGWIVSGSFDLDRIADLVPAFHREEDIESTTVGGLVSEWLGRVPRRGEEVERDGIKLEVLVSDGLRVGQVRISQSQTGAPA